MSLSVDLDVPPRARTAGWRVTATVAGIVALTALITVISLVITNAMAFDPESWVVWGRESARFGWLSTDGGPAWKPLPVILIAPFTRITRGGADVYYWLFIARAGATLGAFGVAAIAHRLAGRTAGVIAGLLIIVSPWWFYNGILGNAEPLMIALITGAVLAHQRGWRALAGLLSFAVCLTRPEVWPFAAIYGAWLSWGHPRRMALTGLAAVIVLVAWAVPNLLDSGGGAVAAATGTATSMSARYAAVPFLEVFKDSFTQLSVLPGLLALAGVLTVAWRILAAWRRGGQHQVREDLNLEWLIVVASVGYVTIVGVMAEIGFAGNPRYLIPALSGFAIIAGVQGARGATWIAVRLRRPAAQTKTVVALAVIAAAVVAVFSTLRTQRGEVAGHERIANLMRAQLNALHCPRVVWTFAPNRSTLAQLADQDVDQSAHPTWFHPARNQFVACAPAWWPGRRDN